MSRAFTIHLTEAAEADLAEIWLYIATAASEAVASRYIHAIETAFEPLRIFPLAGAPRDQIAPGLRVTFHSPYAIYYQPLTDAVVIVRVLHSARDVMAIADHGGFSG